jgi:hypothetical protein
MYWSGSEGTGNRVRSVRNLNHEMGGWGEFGQSALACWAEGWLWSECVVMGRKGGVTSLWRESKLEQWEANKRESKSARWSTQAVKWVSISTSEFNLVKCRLRYWCFWDDGVSLSWWTFVPMQMNEFDIVEWMQSVVITGHVNRGQVLNWKFELPEMLCRSGALECLWIWDYRPWFESLVT